MTLYTPVVITDDEAVAATARSRNWPVVHRDGDTLHLTGVRQSVPLPEPSMDIEGGSLSGPHVAGWKLVLDWLEKHLHRPLMVVEPNDWAQDLALWSASSRGWPVAAWLHEEQPRTAAAGAVALVTSSVGLLFVGDGARERLTADGRFPVLELDDGPLIDVQGAQEPTPSVRKRGVTRVLLVSYFAGDTYGRRAPRAEHWFDTLEKVSGGDITVDLATATAWEGTNPRVHHVPDLGPATLAPGRGPIETWATVAFVHAADKAYAPTHQVGGYWHVALERHFAARDDHYDVVILSGEPFESFAFAAWAQDHWYARTVLDYAGSEALAARRSLPQEAARLAAHAESGWNMAADVTLVARPESIDVVSRSGPDAVIECIPEPEEGERDATTRSLTQLLRVLGPQSR